MPALKVKPVGSVQGRSNPQVSPLPKPNPSSQIRNGNPSAVTPSRPSPTIATQSSSRVNSQTAAPALPLSNNQQPPQLEPQRKATEPVKRLNEPPKLSPGQLSNLEHSRPELPSLPVMSQPGSLDSGPPLLEIQPMSPERPMQPLSKPDLSSRTSTVMLEPPCLDAEDPNDWGVEETISQVSLARRCSLTPKSYIIPKVQTNGYFKIPHFPLSDIIIGPYPINACGSVQNP